MGPVTAFRDPRELDRGELTSLLGELISREQAISIERRALHAQIDALRRELVGRLRDEGTTVVFRPDLPDDGSAGIREPRRPPPNSGSGGAGLTVRGHPGR
jgi:hypothetical protein